MTNAVKCFCCLCCGGIAQLGERLHGMQEVIGSIPFTSTKEEILGFDPIV